MAATRPARRNKFRHLSTSSRPSAPRDQRTRSAYIFGAICPAQGSAAGLVLARCNTAAKALHLTEISRTVTPGAHAFLLLEHPRPLMLRLEQPRRPAVDHYVDRPARDWAHRF